MRFWIWLGLAVLAATAAVTGAPSAPSPERDGAELRTFPRNTMGVHITGGIQGRNDWYVVDLTRGDVFVMRQGRTARVRLTPVELARLQRALEGSGFFSWKIEPSVTSKGADFMTTEIVYNGAKRQHRVTCTDPARPPAGFADLVRRFELLGYAPYWHSMSYMYVSGRLSRVDLEGGFWTLVYAEGSDAAKDPHGGKFVLDVDATLMRGFKDGDLVLATGRVEPERMGIQMAGTHYRVTRLEHLR